eukprot:SAG31_NODE_415_length_15951_cov_13.530848_2_plen_244_part_00
MSPSAVRSVGGTEGRVPQAHRHQQRPTQVVKSQHDVFAARTYRSSGAGPGTASGPALECFRGFSSLRIRLFLALVPLLLWTAWRSGSDTRCTTSARLCTARCSWAVAATICRSASRRSSYSVVVNRVLGLWFSGALLLVLWGSQKEIASPDSAVCELELDPTSAPRSAGRAARPAPRFTVSSEIYGHAGGGQSVALRSAIQIRTRSVWVHTAGRVHASLRLIRSYPYRRTLQEPPYRSYLQVH